MSRTKRRMGEKPHNKSGPSHFDEGWVGDSYQPDGVTAWGGSIYYQYTGKQFGQKYHRFHGDTTPGYGWGNMKHMRVEAENACRVANKRELTRWKQNSTYEVFCLKPRCLDRDR